MKKRILRQCTICTKFAYGQTVLDGYDIDDTCDGMVIKTPKYKYIPAHCTCNDSAYQAFMEKYGNIPRNVIEEKGYEPQCPHDFEEIPTLKMLRELNEKLSKTCGLPKTKKAK